MINSGLIKLKNSDKKIAWYFFAEIIFISSLIASTYSNPYLFLISILAITLLIYFESTSIYTSLFLSIFCALVPFMALSAILGLNFFQSYEGFISSPGSKILIFILFCISFYFHLHSRIIIRNFYEPFFKKIRFYIPIRNEKFHIKIYGSSLNTPKVKRYVNDIMFYLMPFYGEDKNIIIKETGCIKSKDTESGYALGNCVYDNENTVVINISEYNSMQRTKQSMDSKIKTLAHELVHAKQFLKGELNGEYWHGKKYENLVWEDRPWEKEAVMLEKKLFNKHWY
tara:strand:- start:362 stop:1213 length:852 start_codon:yes stop_codon:yes gene_type:complete